MKAISIQIGAASIRPPAIPRAVLSRPSSSASAAVASSDGDSTAWARVSPASTSLALAPYVDMPTPAPDGIVFAELICFHRRNRLDLIQKTAQKAVNSS